MKIKLVSDFDGVVLPLTRNLYGYGSLEVDNLAITSVTGSFMNTSRAFADRKIYFDAMRASMLKYRKVSSPEARSLVVDAHSRGLLHDTCPYSYTDMVIDVQNNFVRCVDGFYLDVLYQLAVEYWNLLRRECSTFLMPRDPGFHDNLSAPGSDRHYLNEVAKYLLSEAKTFEGKSLFLSAGFQPFIEAYNDTILRHSIIDREIVDISIDEVIGFMPLTDSRGRVLYKEEMMSVREEGIRRVAVASRPMRTDECKSDAIKHLALDDAIGFGDGIQDKTWMKRTGFPCKVNPRPNFAHNEDTGDWYMIGNDVADRHVYTEKLREAFDLMRKIPRKREVCINDNGKQLTVVLSRTFSGGEPHIDVSVSRINPGIVDKIMRNASDLSVRVPFNESVERYLELFRGKCANISPETVGKIYELVREDSRHTS